jgi:hypothetical protein
LNIGAAKITEASRKGLLAGTRQKNEIIAQLPEHLRAAANTKLTEHLDTISTPSKYREATRKNILDSVRAETKALLDAEAENLKQKNQYASTVVSARSSGGSGSSTSSVRNGRSNNQRSFTALTDKNGNPIDSVAMALGNRVTNRIENWDSSSDAAKIRNLHNSIKAAGIDTADADIILKDAFDTAYKGDGIFGNNMSKKDIKTMEDRANILVNAYLESSNNNSSGSGGSSSSSSVIGPFTSAKGVADLISKRAKMERELSQVLLDTAIDNTLRGGEPTDPSNSAAPNALIAAYENYMNQAQSTPPAPTTGSVKRSTQTNNKTIPSQSAKAKSKDQIIEDIVANPFEQPKPVVTPKPRVTSPATVLNNSNRAPQSYSSQSPLLNWFKKKMSASSDY